MKKVTPATTWTVTDLAGDSGWFTVTADTTIGEFVSWYGLDGVRSHLALVLDGIQTGNREQGLEDMLAISVEQD